MKKLVSKIEEYYGKDPQKSPDYGRIVSVRHVKRVQSLLEDQKIYHGGNVDVQDRYLEPTLIDTPKLDSKLMKEEVSLNFSLIFEKDLWTCFTNIWC